MNSVENAPSLAEQIVERYKQPKPIEGVDLAKTTLGQVVDTDRKLGLASPHFSKVVDLDKYEAEDNESSPIQYFRHKENVNKRILRIISPFEGQPDALVELPEKPNDPYLRQMISTWKDIQHIVMMDQEMLELVWQMADGYETRQPMIVQGPPARSKTFAAWVFSCMLETPYARMNCSSGTRESYLLGSVWPSKEKVGLFEIKQVLTNPVVLDKIIRYENAIKETEGKKRPLSFDEEDNIASFLTNIRTLLTLDDPTGKYFDEKLHDLLSQIEGNDIPSGKAKLDDPRVIMAYSIISDQTGLELVGDTKYDFVDSDLVRAYEGGGMVVLDELNTINDDGVQNALIPMFEAKNTSMRISSQRNPPEATRNNNFWSIVTINPAATGGRRLLNDPTVSRHLPVDLGPVTDEYVENIVNYFLTGNDPDIRIKGKLYKGRKDVKTPYRPLEAIPYKDLVVKAITEVHTTVTDWVGKDIGLAKREGGFYVFDQRKVTAVLDLMLKYYNKKFAETGGKLSTSTDTDWSGILNSALRQVYAAGVKGEVMDPESDRSKVYNLIEGLPIWDLLDQAAGAKSSPLQDVTTSRGRAKKPSW